MKYIEGMFLDGINYNVLNWISLFTISALIIWALFGEGMWYYPIVPVIIGWLFAEKDYAEDWMNLSYGEKNDVAVLAFKNSMKKLSLKTDPDWLLEVTERSGFFDFLIGEVTYHYRGNRLKMKYDAACQIFIEACLERLEEDALKEVENGKQWIMKPVQMSGNT